MSSKAVESEHNEDPGQGLVTEERILRSGGRDTVKAVRQGGYSKDH